MFQAISNLLKFSRADLGNFGGEFLAVARGWIQSHFINGDSVHWNSDEYLNQRGKFTVRDIEQFAIRVANTTLEEAKRNLITDEQLSAFRSYIDPKNWKLSSDGEMIFCPDKNKLHFMVARSITEGHQLGRFKGYDERKQRYYCEVSEAINLRVINCKGIYFIDAVDEERNCTFECARYEDEITYNEKSLLEQFACKINRRDLYEKYLEIFNLEFPISEIKNDCSFSINRNGVKIVEIEDGNPDELIHKFIPSEHKKDFMKCCRAFGIKTLNDFFEFQCTGYETLKQKI
jgi:hypothetical protein